MKEMSDLQTQRDSEIKSGDGENPSIERFINFINANKSLLPKGVPLLIVPAKDGQLAVVPVDGFQALVLDDRTDKRKNKMKKLEKMLQESRAWLLALAGLVGSAAYQAGLNPPGGAWSVDHMASGKVAGTPVLLYNAPGRYYAFFGGNTTAFVCAMFVMLLVGVHQIMEPEEGIYAISVILVALLLMVIGMAVAYGVGSSNNLPSSLCVGTLLAIVVLICIFTAIAQYYLFSDDDIEDGNGP
ncbi:hypothetical protein ACP70R_021564 [Stipagrostis hirtigluma subsp. patula]